MVLGYTSGADNKTVARRLRVTPATVGKWRKRFSEPRIEGLVDEARPGTPRTIKDEQIEEIIVRSDYV
jgi:transposase